MVAAADEQQEDAVMNWMGQLLGGTWVTRQKLPDGSPIARVSYDWHPDRGGMVLRGVLAGSHGEGILAHDPVRRGVYYVHLHGADTVHFGSLSLDDDTLVREYRALVGAPVQWVSRERFAGADTLRVEMECTEGKQKGLRLAMDYDRVFESSARLPAPPTCSTGDAALGRLAELVGSWQTPGTLPDGRPVAELHYELREDGKLLRGVGRIGENATYSWVGMDTRAKKQFYLDSHGSGSLLFGHYSLRAREVTVSFRSVAGAPGMWETRGRMVAPDRYEARIRPVSDGEPQGEGHAVVLIRAVLRQ